MSSEEQKVAVKRSRIVAAALLAIVLVAALYYVNRRWIAPLAHRDMSGRGTRRSAPDFSVTDLSGRKLTLADYRGKVVMFNFWATWCGPCREEIPDFVELQNRYRNQGLTILGISMDDDPAPVREFYERYRMNYPVAMGNDALADRFGGILGLPTTFLIGRDGRIFAKQSGAADVELFEETVKKLLSEPAGVTN